MTKSQATTMVRNVRRPIWARLARPDGGGGRRLTGKPAPRRNLTATCRADRHRRSPCDPSHMATHGRPDPATPQHANLCDLVLGDLVLRDLVLRDPTAASAVAGRGPKM